MPIGDINLFFKTLVKQKLLVKIKAEAKLKIRR